MKVQSLIRISLVSVIFCCCKLIFCQLNCDIQIVETIPFNMTFVKKPFFNSTSSQLMSLINSAKSSIDIASFYWSLLCDDVPNSLLDSCSIGEKILRTLIKAASKSVKIRIATNDDFKNQSQDLVLLEQAGAIVKKVNFQRLVGAGVLHTKFLIIDNSSFYLGSSNMDWRSYSQVKELGVVVNECYLLASDLAKIFEIYWYLGQNNSSILPKWPTFLETQYNYTNPLNIKLNQIPAGVYITSSPLSFNPTGRTNDIDGLLSVIRKAKKFIYIAVMEYSASFLYSKPKKFWSVIDNALKEAMIDRNVSIRLLASNWTHTRCSSIKFLKSLDSFSFYTNSKGIEVKLMKVPIFSGQEKVPFSRVNHNKYMVTDNSVYIGTSNWSADYFVNSGGAAFIATFDSNNLTKHLQSNQKVHNLQKKLKSIFLRDWYSKYSHHINSHSCWLKPKGS